jgi:hypothetical protein
MTQTKTEISATLFEKFIIGFNPTANDSSLFQLRRNPTCTLNKVLKEHTRLKAWYLTHMDRLRAEREKFGNKAPDKPTKGNKVDGTVEISTELFENFVKSLHHGEAMSSQLRRKPEETMDMIYQNYIQVKGWYTEDRKRIQAKNRKRLKDSL